MATRMVVISFMGLLTGSRPPDAIPFGVAVQRALPAGQQHLTPGLAGRLALRPLAPLKEDAVALDWPALLRHAQRVLDRVDQGVHLVGGKAPLHPRSPLTEARPIPLASRPAAPARFPSACAGGRAGSPPGSAPGSRGGTPGSPPRMTYRHSRRTGRSRRG